MTETSTSLLVAYLAGPLVLGGAERELVNQVKTLQRRGHQTVVLTLGADEPLEQEVRDAGGEVMYVGAGGSRLKRVYLMTKIVALLRPDVLHSQHFYANLYAWLVGRLMGTPAIGSLQSSFTRELEMHPIIGKPSYQWMPWMTANSQQSLRRLRAAGYAASRSFHLVNAVDLPALKAEAKLHGGERRPWKRKDVPTLIIVGRLVEVKRHDRFLRIVQVVREKGCDVQAIVVGDGPRREELEQLAEAMGLKEQVCFLGRRLDVASLLTASDVAVLCSDREGMPNAVQEAMACGLPVVASRVGAVPELLRDGQDGYIVEKENVSAYAQRIVKLAGSKEERRRMGASGRRRMEEHFSLHRLGQTLERMYARVADEP